VVWSVLAANAVGDNLAGLESLGKLFLVELGESPLFGDEELLSAGELELGATQSLEGGGFVLLLDTHRHQRLTDANAGDETLRLTVRTTHTGLETIRTGTRQHLVDTGYVEGVASHTKMEGFFTNGLGHVLVGADSGGFESFGRKLLQLIGDHNDMVGKVQYGRFL